MNKKRMVILSATGTAQKRTLPAVKERQICDVVGIHGRDESKVAQIAEKFGISFHTIDPEKLLDSVQADFAFIGSPPFMHRDQIQLCADRGIPVLCEKPLCVSEEDAQAILALSAQARVEIRVAHHLRHQPAVQFIRELLQSGELGCPRRASMQWAFWVRDNATSNVWKSEVAKGGSHAFYDSGIHAIDMMMYLLPRPSSVVAMGSRSRFPDSLSTVSALFKCDETVAEISTSQATRCPMNELTIDCEDGSISVPYAFSEKPIQRVQVVRNSGVEEKVFDAENPYGQEVVDFIRVLDGQEACGTTLEEGVRGVEILNAISTSISESRVINL